MNRHFREDSTLPTSQRVKRITVDGQDVTNRCFHFDTEHGFAYCWVLQGGAIKVDGQRRKVHETLNGKVEVELMGQNWQDLLTTATADPKATDAA